MQPASFALLTVCGIEELDHHSARDVTHVLSILDPGWPDPDAFGRYRPHHRTVLRFHDVIDPAPGVVPPGPEDVEAILAFGQALGAELGEGGHVLIHCHMGVSRSTAAMTMLLAQAHPDEEADAVVERLVSLRPQAWPNARMIGLADARLGRGGRLREAVRALHARQLARRPDLADLMRGFGRGREVDEALDGPGAGWHS